MSTQPEHMTWKPAWSLSDRLRKIRREGSFGSQAEFAALIGANDNQYRAWESGRNHPRDIVALAKRIELLTGVPANWTLGLDDADSGSNPPPSGGASRTLYGVKDRTSNP